MPNPARSTRRESRTEIAAPTGIDRFAPRSDFSMSLLCRSIEDVEVRDIEHDFWVAFDPLDFVKFAR
jgi:hypothetical protein